MKNLGRERILREYRYLLENTDREHPASTAQIIEAMQSEYDIKTDRNTLARDMSVLGEICGVGTVRKAQNLYFCETGERNFTQEELEILLACVTSSRFISRERGKELEKKILHLATAGSREKLSHQAHIEVPDRITDINSPAEEAAAFLSDAIAAKKRVLFQYYTYNTRRERELKSTGKIYILSPYRLLWDGDFLYVIGYCDSHEKVQAFRVDRIARETLTLLEQDIVPCPPDFSIENYSKLRFRMFGGDKEETVTLRCRAGAMNSLVDHFGKDFALETIDGDTFRAKVTVCASPTFYRWVFGFHGDVRIEGPDEVREAYRAMLQQALDQL